MMDRYEIEGGHRLEGEVTCAGSKNGTLPLMAAALLADGVTFLNRVPNLQDVHMMSMVLRVIGADVRLDDSHMRIDCSHCNFWEAPYELVRKMRASFYVLGPLIARFRKARVSLPGGCNLGPRPVDLHLKSLKKLGCNINIDAGYVEVEAEHLHGAWIDLDKASVGATGNIMMAAVGAEGRTVINNAACEPEIEDLANMLNAMGAQIEGAGTRRIEITGPVHLKPVEWDVIPDRIEAGTLLTAAAITRGHVTVKEARPAHLEIFLDKLAETGANISTNGSEITLDARNTDLKAVDVTTAVFPGFPTDLQAPWTSLMSIAAGSAIITDTIYPERFSHVPELIRLGADISKEMNSAHVNGGKRLKGASVMCSDIRAAAAIVLATLAAEGSSSVLRIYHLDRGYQKLEDKLNILGARIRRVRE